MKALWLENKKLRFRNDLPVPEPSPGEALVKIRAAGICGTDLELVKGYYPFTGIPGHEFIGVVMKAPDDPDFEGKRVVGDITISPADNAGNAWLEDPLTVSIDPFWVFEIKMGHLPNSFVYQ
jgi:threonine dehydrogenase-like Zn-dependent dehydrogenase